MTKINNHEFIKIKNWMYRNARPIDFARWKYHFENGPSKDVLSVLSYYQNNDGGFGHALEADSWNAFSSALQTSTAILILREIDCYDESHTLIKNILTFLENDTSFEPRGWTQKVPTNNDYPHAPWWTYDENTVGGFHSDWEYNPTAVIAGFVLRVLHKRKNNFYWTCFHIAQKAIDKLLFASSIEPHELGCFCMLYADLKAIDAHDDFDFMIIEKRLKELVNTSIENDISKWSTYVTKPSNFIDSPSNIFNEDNRNIMDCELDYIINSINIDGIWDISWNWGAYEKEFAISENWWKANLVIINLLLLKKFDRA